MRRANGILSSLRLVQSFLVPRSLHSQVTTHYSHLSPLTFSSSLQNQAHNFIFLNTHQKLYFSSTPKSILDLITTNEWSQDLEQEFEKSNPTQITHETVVYVLKNLLKTPQKALHFFNWVLHRHGFKPSSMVYGLMLRILSNKENLNDFWDLAKKMEQEGCDLDKKACRTVLGNFWESKMMTEATEWTEFFKKINKESVTDANVKIVVDMVLESDLNEDMKKKLEEVSVTLSEDTILKIFWGLYGYPFKALLFFRWLSEHMRYTHNGVTYNAIARVLAQKESIQEFWRMVKEMKSAGHELDLDTYVKISRKFERSGMMKDSVELYELMMDGPYKPPADTCSVLLMAISSTDTPDMNLVSKVVKKYEATTGHNLPKDAYDWMYRCLISLGKFDEAKKTLDDMKNAGFEPDKLTYDHVVFGLCKSGRLDEATKLLDEMELNGCTPDMKTWSSLIRGHCAVGEIDQALKCLARMSEKNFELDPVLLDALVNGLCDKERMDHACSMVVELVDKAKLRPLQSTYENLIKKLLQERKLKEAMNLLNLMKKHNYRPFQAPYVDYISKFGSVDDAAKFLDALGVKKYPPSSVYLHVLQSFLEQGRQSEVQELLEKCPNHIRNHADALKLLDSLELGNAMA